MNLLKHASFFITLLLVSSESFKAELIIESDALRSNLTLYSVSPDFGKEIFEFAGYHNSKTIAASSNSDLAFSTIENVIFIYDTKTFEMKRAISDLKSTVRSLTYLSNGCLISAAHTEPLRVWSPDSYIQKGVAYHTTKWNKVIEMVAGYYATGDDDGWIRVHVTRRNYITGPLGVDTSPVLSLAYLKSEEIVGGYADSTIKIWDWKNRTLKRTLRGHSSNVTALAQLPNGDLVSGSTDKTLRLWNPADATLKRTMTDFNGPITSIVVLKNGLVAVSTSTDAEIKIVDIQLGMAMYSFKGHKAPINELALLPDGNLVSASQDTKVKIWKAF